MAMGKLNIRTSYILVFLFLWNMKLVHAQLNITDSIVHQNFQRKFMVHFPPGYATAADKRALIVNLHGGGGTMVNAQGFSNMNPISDVNGFILAWPQGYGISGTGFTWADGRNTTADQAGVDDVGFLHKLIDSLVQRYRIDTTKIYICGFSNGGFMVQRLACETPRRFAAMASLGSSLDTVRYRNCNPNKAVPMAFFNGTSDPAMPYGGGPLQNPVVIPVVPVDTALQFWVKHNRCSVANPVINIPDTFTTDNSTAQLFTYSNCHCNANVYFYKFINGGHTWPGVYIASQASALGNTNRDLNAGVELWNFFKLHTLCTVLLGENNVNPAIEIVIYPNPVSHTLNIENIGPFTATILDMKGQQVWQGSQTQIDVSAFHQGVYVIVIEHQGKYMVKKFVK